MPSLFYMLKRFCILLLLNQSLTVHAAEVEIGGLLIDNTMSRMGREFSHQFSQLWQDVPNTQGINVQIKEQVVPRAGTKLTLIMNNRLIYVTHLGRRQSPIKDRVEQAIFLLLDAMTQSQFSQNNPDLANDGW
ncbi:MAG: curli production assembly protein CsgE [Gammaproteobacteria bacterium]|nr:curli production assembly protein CsgE [Gammaproteobacteria bacterium]